ncbi:bifunctional metallophosphatase/5'-nucleotidase [Deinococcus aluminii]|uniref:Trifunctional nucleotide phosphoesterase protein YfkN n=1 Tax=Deinococcus aluminii TaxID=1656885 RepID=A0ABP9XFB1_9DEIO
MKRSHVLLPALFLAAAPPAQAVTLQLITFNDVYEINPVNSGKQGGLARVATLVNKWRFQNPNTLVLFAGDLISPSVMSSVFKGEQMTDALNTLGVNYASLGNHEFDGTLTNLAARVAESKFTWLDSNLLVKDSGKPVAGTAPDALTTVGGVKVGLFAVSYDFTDLLADKNAVRFEDVIATAQAETKKLRDAGAQYVIALTHEDAAADCRLSAAVPGLDLIVGGHDHDAMFNTQCGHAPYVKASSDWKNVWRIQVNLDDPKAPALTLENVPVDASVRPNLIAQRVVDRWNAKLSADLGQTIGRTTVALDAVTKDNRTRETNLGNFIADAQRQATGTDAALVNGGNIRTDQLYPAGNLTKKDIYGILPFGNIVTVIKVTGAQLKAALENGVSQVETVAGRFPQVSGLTFAFNPATPAGQRVSDVLVGGQPLDPARTYTLSINDYLLGGGDGYTMFPGLPVLTGAKEGRLLADVVVQAVTQAGMISPATEGRITVK